MRVMEKSGFLEKAGAENFCGHIDDALKRAAEITEKEETYRTGVKDQCRRR